MYNHKLDTCVFVFNHPLIIYLDLVAHWQLTVKQGAVKRLVK